MSRKDCYDELERVCRLIAYSQHDNKSLEYCCKALAPPLIKLAKLREEAAEKKEQTRPYGPKQK